MPKKSASTIGKSLQPTGIWLLSVPVGGKFEPCLGGVGENSTLGGGGGGGGGAFEPEMSSLSGVIHLF